MICIYCEMAALYYDGEAFCPSCSRYCTGFWTVDTEWWGGFYHGPDVGVIFFYHGSHGDWCTWPVRRPWLIWVVPWNYILY